MRPAAGKVIKRGVQTGCVLGLALLLPACHFGQKRVVKAEGICVVAANAQPVTINALDSPDAAGYLPQTRFGPGEQPMAVVVGYGGKGASLELLDLASGRSLGTKTLHSNLGEASLQPLLIETSGDYELRLLVDA